MHVYTKKKKNTLSHAWGHKSIHTHTYTHMHIQYPSAQLVLMVAGENLA